MDASDQVEAFSVTSLSRSFNPELNYLSALSPQPLRLNLSTFEDVSEQLRISPAGRGGYPPVPNGRWHYSEMFDIPNPLYRKFFLIHGFTGSGFKLDSSLPGDVFSAMGECADSQLCLPSITEPEMLVQARAEWPVTTFTVIGDGVPVERPARMLGVEPLDDDIAAADRS